MPGLRHLVGADLDAVETFERVNRAYFARSLIDRGDEFYESLAEHHRSQLDEQDDGTCAYFVLVDSDDAIIGRFNLYEITGETARVGYRVAEHAAGRGVATRALVQLCRTAVQEYGLRTLSAETTIANLASQRVLLKAGFTSSGPCEVAGKPGRRFTTALVAAI